MSRETVKLLEENLLYDTNLVSVFCSLGVMFKGKLVNPVTTELKLADVISYGINFYLEKRGLTLDDLLNTDIKLKDLIEIYYYFNIIESYSGNALKSYYIQKDTTCSMAQHAGKLLGYKAEALKLLNLSNFDKLHDTYQVYINDLMRFLKKELITILDCHTINELDKYLKRSLLKNLIMTCEYGVTYYTAWREYRQAVYSETLPENIRDILLLPGVFSIIFKFFKCGGSDAVFYTSSKAK